MISDIILEIKRRAFRNLLVVLPHKSARCLKEFGIIDITPSHLEFHTFDSGIIYRDSDSQDPLL